MIRQHFSIQGYFEELYEYERAEYLGTRLVEWPNRPFGSPGTIDIEITENITLTRGLKTKIYKASPKKPLKCRATLQMLCGRDLKLGDPVIIRMSPEGKVESWPQGNIKSFNDDDSVTVANQTTEFTVQGWRLTLNR